MNLWFTNASYAPKPRTMHMCNECQTPCYPGIGRNKMTVIDPELKTQATNYFHLHCFPKFLSKLVREHRAVLKEKQHD